MTLNQKLMTLLILMSFFLAGPDSIFNKQLSLRKMMLSKPLNVTLVNEVINAGSIGGYYTHDEFYNLTNNLAESFPQYLSPKVNVGKTFLNKHIYGLQLGELSGLIRKQSREISHFNHITSSRTRIHNNFHCHQSHNSQTL